METRSLRGDLIEVFKILKLFIPVEYLNFFSAVKYWFSYSYKLFKSQARIHIRKYFFSVTVIDIWNSLPEELLQCRTVKKVKVKASYTRY